MEPKPQASPPPTRVEPVAEIEAAPPPAPTPIPPPPRRDRTEAVLSAFEALGFAVSARFILFAALIGGFVLAIMAMSDPTLPRLGVLVAYNVLCVIPMVFLEFVRRQR